jgi:hypothetical protein
VLKGKRKERKKENDELFDCFDSVPSSGGSSLLIGERNIDPVVIQRRAGCIDFYYCLFIYC